MMMYVVFFAVLLAVAGVDAGKWTADYYTYWNASDPCPAYQDRVAACTTGSCGDDILVTLYGIPTGCKLFSVSNSGKLTPTGVFKTAFADAITASDDVAITLPVNGQSGSNATISSIVNALQLDDPNSCCTACQLYDGTGDYSDYPKCEFYQQFPINGPGSGTGTCFMWSGSARPACKSTTYNLNMVSIIGAVCDSGINNDPHLVGAHGTPYDFSGTPDQTFALITDEKLEVNMKLTGYLDDRTESATLLKDGKAVRTWIRELGIMWVDYMGKQHRLTMLARPGKVVSRGPGLLRSAFLDGKAVPRMQPGEQFIGAGGAVIKMQAVTKEGPYEVDQYNLLIDGVLDLDMRLRVAHKLLQLEGESQCHFSLGINSLTPTDNIHGVLGQTYRKDHAQRAEAFSLVVAKLHHNIQADGADGKGFLDGTAADYRTSGVLSADSKFNVFGSHVARSLRGKLV